MFGLTVERLGSQEQETIKLTHTKKMDGPVKVWD